MSRTAPSPDPAPSGLPGRHLLLALAVVAIWGTNFVVIKRGLAEWPPFLFAALRFTVSALPLVLFVRRPAIAAWRIAAFGLLIGTGLFALLFHAMRADISPGLASLVVQTQVFFTIGLAIVLAGERVRAFQWVALALATAGIAVIAVHTDAQTTVAGVSMVLFAALSWAVGNHVTRRAGRVDMLAFVVWSSVYALPPLVALSWWFEGPARVGAALAQAGAGTWAAVLWQSVGNTLFGYAAWAWLLARHPAAAVSPLALGVPVFGMAASALVLAEPLPGWKLGAAALVMAGLALNVLWPRLRPAVSGG